MLGLESSPGNASPYRGMFESSLCVRAVPSRGAELKEDVREVQRSVASVVKMHSEILVPGPPPGTVTSTSPANVMCARIF